MARNEFLQESKKQIDSFKEEMAEIKEKSVQLSEEGKIEFEKRAKELEELYADASAKYDVVQQKTEDSWHEVRDFMILTNKALKHSFNYFLSHYRK